MKTLIVILLLAIPAFAQVETPFTRMFDAPRIADKKAIWNSLTREEQVEARRDNFTWGVAHLDLNAEQIEYLSRFSAALPLLTEEGRDAFQTEALKLFPKQKAQLLFGSIGPYKSCEMFIPVRATLPICWCNIGSSFNMQCDTECGPPLGRCEPAPEGCGFAWLYKCDGWC